MSVTWILKGTREWGGDLTFSRGLWMEKKILCNWYVFIYVFYSPWPFVFILRSLPIGSLSWRTPCCFWFFLFSILSALSEDLWFQWSSPGLSFYSSCPSFSPVSLACLLIVFFAFLFTTDLFPLIFTVSSPLPPPCALTLLCIYWSSSVSPLSLSHQLCSSSILS